MKKRIFVVVTALILVIICIVMTSCDTQGIAGNWIPNDELNQDVHGSNRYPDEYLLLNSDGSGSVDGYSLMWTAENGKLTLNISAWSYVYDYTVSGNKLMLDDFTLVKN